MSRPDFKQYEWVFFNGIRSQIVAVNPTSKTFNIRSANSLAQNIEANALFPTYEEWQAANGDDPLVKKVDLLAWHKPPVAPRPTPKLAINPNPPPKAVQGDQFIAPMSKIEAQTLVNQIRSSMNSVADKLLQLKERDGWKALGYANWRDCVTAEFDLSQTRVYQLLAYAEVQQNISTIGGKTPTDINERQARELAKAPAEQQAPILEKAIETAPNGKLTAQHIKRTVEIETRTQIDYVDPETGEILNSPPLKPTNEPESLTSINRSMPEVIASLTDYLMNHGWFTGEFSDGVMTSKHLSGAEMVVTLKAKGD